MQIQLMEFRFSFSMHLLKLSDANSNSNDSDSFSNGTYFSPYSGSWPKGQIRSIKVSRSGKIGSRLYVHQIETQTYLVSLLPESIGYEKCQPTSKSPQHHWSQKYINSSILFLYGRFCQSLSTCIRDIMANTIGVCETNIIMLDI